MECNYHSQIKSHHETITWWSNEVTKLTAERDELKEVLDLECQCRDMYRSERDELRKQYEDLKRHYAEDACALEEERDEVRKEFINTKETYQYDLARLEAQNKALIKTLVDIHSVQSQSPVIVQLSGDAEYWKGISNTFRSALESQMKLVNSNIITTWPDIAARLITIAKEALARGGKS
jgi:predicted RNase H-like nuclease (RuvC/YqgF family)